MKKKAILITLIICTIILCIFILVFFMQENPSSNKDIATTESTKQVITSGYILKEYNGKIATFRSGSKTPIEVFDVYVSTLPKSEINVLKKGLHAKDDQELQELIEAYTS